MSDIPQAASQLARSAQALLTPRHEYQETNARNFRHLDLGFYDQARDGLIAQGCRCFGDYENLTVKAQLIDLRTFIRVLGSEDQTIGISLYHPKPKFWVRVLLWIIRQKLGKIVDCETEFSDGRYLITTNAEAASPLKEPPSFDQLILPAHTSYEVVFQTHQQRLKNFLTANPGVQPTLIRTAEESQELQHRMQAIKAAYRQLVGGLTADELKDFGFNPETAIRIKHEMDRQAQESASQ